MIRLTSLLALFLVGCKPNGSSRNDVPSGSSTNSSKLAGTWTGSFTVTEATVGTIRQPLNEQLPGVCRLRFTSTGAVTVEMGGFSRTHSRRGEVFHNIVGNIEMTQTVVDFAATDTQVRVAYVDFEKEKGFDISRSVHAIIGSLTERRDARLTETTFTLSGNQLNVRSVQRQHNEAVTTTGTFTRAGD